MAAEKRDIFGPGVDDHLKSRLQGQLKKGETSAKDGFYPLLSENAPATTVGHLRFASLRWIVRMAPIAAAVGANSSNTGTPRSIATVR